MVCNLSAQLLMYSREGSIVGHLISESTALALQQQHLASHSLQQVGSCSVVGPCRFVSAIVCQELMRGLSLESFCPPFTAWKQSCIQGSGCWETCRHVFKVTLQSQQIRTTPSGLITGSIGVTHSQLSKSVFPRLPSISI